MEYNGRLIEILDVYLEDKIDYKDLADITQVYFNLLKETVSIELDNEEGREGLSFDNGHALGSHWAFTCIKDIIRTRQFIRGINKAFEDVFTVKDSIDILYAGTGPYAALLLPFIAKYTTKNIRYTLLEVNPLSFQVLEKLISKLHLDSAQISLVQTDATKYKIESRSPDIVISETMQRLLSKEQQVPIYYNLMNQVTPKPIFIPEKIEIVLSKVKNSIPQESILPQDYMRVSSIFEVSLDAFNRYKNSDSDQLEFPSCSFNISRQIMNGHHMFLSTEIQVYKDEKILPTESGLTIPYSLGYHIHKDDCDYTIESQYVVGKKTGLNFKLVRGEKRSPEEVKHI